MEELDEFGIPIKKATSQHSVDEFGIPIKKKVDTTSTIANQKSASDANTGSLGGVKRDELYPKSNLHLLPITREKQLKNELSNVKVTSKNMDEINAKTNELSAIQKGNAKKSLDAHNRVLNPLWEQANKIDTNKIQKEIDDEANDNQWTDKVREGLKTVAKPFYNALANFVAGDEDPIDFLPKKEPLKAQKQVVDKNIKEIQKKSPYYNPTPEQKFQMVKDLKYKDLADEQVAKNISNIASNIQGYFGLLDKDDAKIITSLADKQVNKLQNASDVSKGITYQIQMLDAQSKPLQDLVEHDRKHIESGQATEEEKTEWTNNNNALINNRHKYEDLLTQQQKADKGKMSAEEHVHQLKLDYAPFSKFTDDVAGSFGGAIGGISYFAGAGLGTLSNAFGNPMELSGLSKGLKEGGEALLTDAKNRTESHPQYTSNDILESHPLGWAGQTLSSLLPYIVSDGTVGLTANVAKSTLVKNALFAFARSGEKLHDINKEEESNPNIEYSDLQKLGSMGTSAVAELVMLGGVSRLTKAFKPSLEVMKPFEKEVFEQGIEGFVKKSISKSGTFIKEANKSGVTFATVEGIKMASDNLILGKKVDNFSDKLIDAYKEGWILHGATSAIPAIVNTSKYLSEKVIPNKTLVEIKNNNGQIFKHQTELENTDLDANEAQSVKVKIKELEDKNHKLYSDNINKVSKFTSLQVKELLTIDQDKFAIRNKTEEIKNGNYSNDYKKSALQELKTNFQDLEKRRESVFTKESNPIDILEPKEKTRLMNDAEENLQNKLNPNRDKELKLSQEDIEKEAVKIHLKELETKKLEDAKTESPIAEVQPEVEPKTEVQEPTNAEQEKVDESIQNRDIIPNGKVGVRDNADLQQQQVEDMQPSANTGEGKTPIEHAREQINNGILEWNGDINSPRIDLEMSWADIRKGQIDLANGKENTVPAKRLVEAINNAKESGGYNYKYGTGGENMRAKEFVSFEDLQKTKNEYQLNDAELKEVKDNELENAKKYDEYFNKLSKEEQIDILDDYENRGNTNTGEVSENVNGGEIKENISNEQTKSERGQESVGIEKVISSDARRERSSEEKAKDLGIEHDKYLDFKDLVEKTPSSGVFKDYLSGKTIEETFGKATNDQSYEATVLLDASQHGDIVLQHAKELFGENYVPKTLEFLKDAKMDNFEKAVVYASMENLMDTKVKESPENKSLKSLQELVYKDSQANLSNSSKGLNTGRLRRIHNAVKNGYDIELLTDKVYNDKQLEAKDTLKDIDVSGENLNKESDNITDAKLEKLIAEGVQAEIKKLAKNLPTSRRIKADKAIKALEEIQKGLRNKTYDATIGVPITIIDSGITVIKNALDIGTNLIDAIEMGINHIREKHGKDWEENTFREDFIKGFKDRNIDVKETKISDIVKQALIDAGFSRDIKIKGEVKKVLDWVKLTGRMNNVDALKENVETKLKEQGYTDKQISDISTELEAEYKRLTQNVTDKAIADLERRNLIKPSPNRKSDSKRLADLYNQGLFGDNVKKYENVINSILGFSDIDFKKYSEIQKKAKTMSDIYNQKVDGKPLTDLSISSLASNINKEISDLLTLASLKESGKDGIAGNIYKSTEIFKQFSSLGMKSLLGTIRGLAENKFSGVYAGMLQKLVTRGEMTPELAKQLKKNADVVLKDITQQGGTDYGNTQTTLVSGSLLEDIASNKIKSKTGHQILTAITIRRFLNGYDSYAKVKLTETLFVKNSIKILEKKGWSKKDALNHISEALTGDNFTKALETAKNIIDNVNSQQDTKQLKDNSETVHRFAMDIVKQNLMNGDVMTMAEIQKSFNASYKGAGSDIGHEANNYLAVQVGHYSQKLSTELNEAIKDKNWELASLKNIEIMVNKIIINPFAGGGSNWVVIGAEKGVPVIGYIPTMANALKRTELDLESVTGQKNIEKSLYYDYKTKSSFVRNIAGTGMALTAYATMFGMSGFGLKDDDEENNAKKLNDWMNKNDWVKPYFNKLSPFAFVMATAVNDCNYGKLLAQTFGMSGEVFNNSLKVIKSLDNDKEGSTSGAIGKLLGQFGNSPIAWKYLLDAINIHRGLKGESQIKTDYELEGFLDGFYQGGFVEATGLVIDDLRGVESTSKTSSSKHKVGRKKLKKYKKF